MARHLAPTSFRLALSLIKLAQKPHQSVLLTLRSTSTNLIFSTGCLDFLSRPPRCRRKSTSSATHRLPQPLRGQPLHARPNLTPLGEQQCRDLSQSFPALSSIDLIVASPIKRTLYTALLTFRPLLEQHKNLKNIALPWLQEISDLPCDTGSPLAELQREFSDQPVDLSLVTPGWHEKTGIYAPTAENIMARARARGGSCWRARNAASPSSRCRSWRIDI